MYLYMHVEAVKVVCFFNTFAANGLFIHAEANIIGEKCFFFFFFLFLHQESDELERLNTKEPLEKLAFPGVN